MRLILVIGWMAVLCACSNGATSSLRPSVAVVDSTTSPTVATTPGPTTSTTLGTFPSPAAAAAAFIAAWQRGDRTEAARLAAPTVVDSLFAHVFQPVDERGCQDPVGDRASCVFRFGGRLLTVAVQDEHGWAVSAVDVA